MKQNLLIGVWILSIIASIGFINRYSLTAGKNSSNSRVPASTKFAPEGRARLLVFLHPKCTCSHATMTELKSLLPELKDIETTVLFRSVSADKAWLTGDLYENASKVQGISVAIDEDGREAKLFGAHTSGHTVLIAPDGNIVFSGGLTPSRGHTGDSAGKNFLRKWNRERGPASFISAIFGCNIFKEQK